MIIFVFLLGIGLIWWAYSWGKNWKDWASEGKRVIVLLWIGGCAMILGGFLLLSVSGGGSSSSGGSKCTICGGEMYCAICGEDGLYCENASYGSGSDHFCSKHWGDVVEWHRGK